ncbi:MAG: prepilin-type N-terminal cleavage/methylation domain-containing protein [Verrucomicrobiota bacterium]
MKSTRPLKTHGFTLVELLVVIVIVGSLAALALTLGPRMMARAKFTESMQNIRQISPLLTTYAADNNMTLPPVEGDVRMADGTVETLQWNEVCLTLIYPETELTVMKNKSWWNANKVVLKNPMFKESTALKPGYAMNENIASNIDSSNDLTTAIALSLIPDPTRTPLVAPYTDFRYNFSGGQVASFGKDPQATLLSEGKLPVVFVDGHMETMTPKEYLDRRLNEMPLEDE